MTLRVFSAAMTAADCFKFRNKIGIDVALEALREYRRLHLNRLDELWRCARLDRVTAVMRPFGGQPLWPCEQSRPRVHSGLHPRSFIRAFSVFSWFSSLQMQIGTAGTRRLQEQNAARNGSH